ncbi:MAG: hypothetical protein R3C01_07140 [Planctomycetaceae bacterium]
MFTKRLQYRYNALGNRVGMTELGGGRVTYGYDEMNRLALVVNPQGERTSYVYDAAGRRTLKQLANGSRTAYSYDAASQTTQVESLKSDDSTIVSFQYGYDDAGNRTSVLEADGSRVTWAYDAASQLISEDRSGTNPYSHAFQYDSRGNRLLKIEDGQRTTTRGSSRFVMCSVSLSTNSCTSSQTAC